MCCLVNLHAYALGGARDVVMRCRDRGHDRLGRDNTISSTGSNDTNKPHVQCTDSFCVRVYVYTY